MAVAVIFNYPIEFPADHCERLVPDPATARRLVSERRPELQALLDAGWSNDDIVTLSQLVAFLAFQIRAAAGLRILAQTRNVP